MDRDISNKKERDEEIEIASTLACNSLLSFNVTTTVEIRISFGLIDR